MAPKRSLLCEIMLTLRVIYQYIQDGYIISLYMCVHVLTDKRINTRKMCLLEKGNCIVFISLS